MQRQHFNPPLAGLFGAPSRVKRQTDCGADVSLGSGQPSLSDSQLRTEHRNMAAVSGAQLGHHLRARPHPAQHAVRLREQQPCREEAPRRGRFGCQSRNGLLHPRDGVGESPAGQIDGANRHVGHTPRQILAGRRDLHKPSGLLFRGGELAGQRQRANFAERRQEPQQTVDPALDHVPALGLCQNVHPASHQRQRQPAAEDRPAHRRGRCGRVESTCCDSATACPSWFSNTSDAEATPSTSARSAGSLTLPRMAAQSTSSTVMMERLGRLR